MEGRQQVNPKEYCIKESQYFSNHLIMVRPYQFYSNNQTQQSNIYQSSYSLSTTTTTVMALQQFDNFCKILENNKLTLTIIQDPGYHNTPDSIFPNNWISFHNQNQCVIYPMFAQNRRNQKELPLIKTLQAKLGKTMYVLYDYSNFVKENIFLEGTGSLVLDRQNKIAYACLSQRTSKQLVQRFCKDMKYEECSFTASQMCSKTLKKVPIYHTNVMMSVSKDFILICLELIDTIEDQLKVKQFIQKSNKKIIQLASDQILNFTGNALTVKNLKDQYCIIMSQKALKSLTKDQIQQIQIHTKIISANLDTIQKNGGGSARCMLAQLF